MDRGGPESVFDAGKQILGRKRHVLVDTLGLLLLVVVHSAGAQDRNARRAVLAPLANRFSKLRSSWADSIYKRGIAEWIRNLRRCCRIESETVKRPEGVKGFLVLLLRGVMERAFAWLSFHRRPNKDYEQLPKTSEAFIHIAMIRLMLARLT